MSIVLTVYRWHQCLYSFCGCPAFHLFPSTMLKVWTMHLHCKLYAYSVYVLSALAYNSLWSAFVRLGNVKNIIALPYMYMILRILIHCSQRPFAVAMVIYSKFILYMFCLWSGWVQSCCLLFVICVSHCIFG